MLKKIVDWRPTLFGFGNKSLPKMARELKQLTIDYAKQETLDPLKGLLMYVVWGLAGSLLLSIGLTLWVISLLRVLQEETGSAFTGHLTWVPYALTLVGTVLIVALAALAIGKERRAAKRRKARKQKLAASSVSTTPAATTASPKGATAS